MIQAAEHEPVRKSTVHHSGSVRTMVSIFNPANFLTAFRILLVPVYLWLFASGTPLTAVLALVVFVTAAVTDLYDGRLARHRKEITKLGKFLDPLADKFLVVGALVQFWVMALVSFWLVLVIVVRDVWVTVMRVAALAQDAELKTSRDAKLKTTIQLTVVITIIVLYGARLIVTSAIPSYRGALVDMDYYRLVFDGLLGVAVVFTLYSWMTYLLRSAKKRA
ncbi:CDP-alcohol phosphatidyltransferase family protein [Candidatus Latescibacterota bacterium]